MRGIRWTRSVLPPSSRCFSCSLPSSMPRRRTGNPTGLVGMTAEEAEEALDLDFEYDDTSTLGHLVLREQRQRLYYARLIEHEMPKLVAYRKAYVPPTSATPLIVRSIDYAGEEHPATVKRCIVVPVSQLPLPDERSIHKIKLLAGPRWTPDLPSDSGVSPNDPGREHGYIKIACEDFPKPGMNLKWASDALDRLIAEANNTKDDFSNIPLDTRHIAAKARKAKKGEHTRNRLGRRPSLKDFPKEWLPSAAEKHDREGPSIVESG